MSLCVVRSIKKRVTCLRVFFEVLKPGISNVLCKEETLIVYLMSLRWRCCCRRPTWSIVFPLCPLWFSDSFSCIIALYNSDAFSVKISSNTVRSCIGSLPFQNQVNNCVLFCPAFDKYIESSCIWRLLFLPSSSFVSFWFSRTSSCSVSFRLAMISSGPWAISSGLRAIVRQ